MSLEAAWHYQDMVLRWLRVKREFPGNQEPKPEPWNLTPEEAETIFERVERDFNR